MESNSVQPHLHHSPSSSKRSTVCMPSAQGGATLSTLSGPGAPAKLAGSSAARGLLRFGRTPVGLGAQAVFAGVALLALARRQ